MRIVYDFAKEYNIQIVAIICISNERDPIEYFIDSSQCLCIFTADIVQWYSVSEQIEQETKEPINEHNYKHIDEIGGIEHKHP